MTVYSTVTPLASIKFNEVGKEAPRISGAVYVNPHVFGSTRAEDGDVAVESRKLGGIVRYLASDPSSYEILRFAAPASHTTWPWAVGMAAITYAGGSLWTVGRFRPNSGAAVNWLFRIDPVTFTETGRWEAPGTGREAITSDGTVLYMVGASVIGRRAIADPGTEMTGAILANTSTQPALAAINGMQPNGLHAIAIGTDAAGNSDGYLYINNTQGGQTQQWGYLLKVRTSDLQAVGYVEIPLSEDDMGQDDLWIYPGQEEFDSARNAEGMTWGALAVRKSDLARFVLPKLGASDVTGAMSFATLSVGQYMISLKSNAHVYFVDKSNPASWHIGMTPTELEAVLVHDATLSLPAGIVTSGNELLVDDDGNLHSFIWNTTESTAESSAIKYAVAGIDLRVPPSVNTAPATLVSRLNNKATLNGDIVSSGGAVVTERGFMYGTTNPPPTTKYPASGTASGPFSLAVTNLPEGIVHYRAYAVNPQGESVGHVVSFDTGPNTTGPAAAIIGGVTMNVEAFGRLPDEQGGGDWKRANWQMTVLFEKDVDLATFRAAIEDLEPRVFRRVLNGGLRGGPLTLCSGTLLGDSVVCGVEIGEQPIEITAHVNQIFHHKLSLTLREE
jgi:hypothetical protein